MNKLIANVEQWSFDKNLHKADSAKQFLKVIEEVGETASALARGNQEGLKDGIGDVIVTMIILAQQNGLTVEECLRCAYYEIKGRKGKMVNGVFVKESDLKEEVGEEDKPLFSFIINDKLAAGTICKNVYKVFEFEGDSTLLRVVWDDDDSNVYERETVIECIEEGDWIKV